MYIISLTHEMFLNLNGVGMEEKAQWPFVTLNSFQRRASVTKSLSGSVFLGSNHYVEESQRSAWETYTAADASNYLSDSYDYFSELGIPYSEQLRQNSIYMFTSETSMIDDPGPGPYLVSLILFFVKRGATTYLTTLRCSLAGRYRLCQVHTLLV
jgi:hypothetical protein